MTEPIWLEYDAVIALQAATIMEHGGSPGLREDGLLRSALARPQNLHAYEGVEDLPRLAASYAFGVAKNHAFVDGNKRAAFLCAVVFMEANGLVITASEPEAAATFLALAAGEMSETDLVEWLRANS